MEDILRTRPVFLNFIACYYSLFRRFFSVPIVLGVLLPKSICHWWYPTSELLLVLRTLLVPQNNLKYGKPVSMYCFKWVFGSEIVKFEAVLSHAFWLSKLFNLTSDKIWMNTTAYQSDYIFCVQKKCVYWLEFYTSYVVKS